MTIFQSKDFSPGKSDKVRAAFGRKLGKANGAIATNAEVDNEVNEFIKRVVQADDDALYYAAKPPADPL